MYVVFGMPEIGEKTHRIYNTAVLIGPEGLVGKYRKIHVPAAAEERHFYPGYEAAVFETHLGKLGLIIYYDVFFSEVSRLTRLQGAQLIACVSASPKHACISHRYAVQPVIVNCSSVSFQQEYV